MSDITKEEWVQWKANRVTQAYLRDLTDNRRGIMEEWAEGRTSTEREDLIIQGRCQGIKDAVQYALRTFEVRETQQGEEDND